MRVRIGKREVDCPDVWFTSDWHLNHTNIIKYCNRPFDTVEEMNISLLDRCNSLVKKSDVLFYLGDWCFHHRYNKLVEFAKIFRDSLVCKNIYFLFGNHDRKLREDDNFKKLWIGTYDLLEIKVKDQSIVLCHYAMRTWNKSHHGSWHLYGHSHGGLSDDTAALSFDCGTDCFNFFPINFTKVEEIIKEKILHGAGKRFHHEP